jgi:hypothetical protein
MYGESRREKGTAVKRVEWIVCRPCYYRRRVQSSCNWRSVLGCDVVMLMRRGGALELYCTEAFGGIITNHSSSISGSSGSSSSRLVWEEMFVVCGCK